jgi:hypothetical protein
MQVKMASWKGQVFLSDYGKRQVDQQEGGRKMKRGASLEGK